MRVEILEESGYRCALFGIGMSYGLTSGKHLDDVDDDLRLRLQGIAKKLAGKGSGHDKFLRQIQIIVDVTAPRYWWIEFDTYKVGTTAQSESTMHTIMKRPLDEDMFSDTLEAEWLRYLNRAREDGDFATVLKHLPQSFMQRRIVSMNYAVFQNIVDQRKDHKLHEWHWFIRDMMRQLAYPELIKRCYGEEI